MFDVGLLYTNMKRNRWSS